MKEGRGADLNENLCCSLCKSYLIDAVTLTDCLHSYCRACLLYSIEKNDDYRCAKCACSFSKDLAEAFSRDETLQKVVYKAVPEVYWQELQRRGEFIKKRTVSPDEKALILDKKLIQLASQLCAPNEMVSLCLEYISPGVPENEAGEDSNGDKGEASYTVTMLDENKPSTVAEADRLGNQEAIMTSFRRYFRCVAATKVSALRKLLEAKLEVSDTYRLFFVDSDCNSTLDDQCTLQDVAYMFSWQRDGPMKVLFTLQRHLEEEKPPVLDMEFMPELVAEEPLSQGNTAVTAAIETPIHLPALTVSLNTSMMEGGANHQPIITTEVHPPPRKKRKPTAPMKKQQVASPAPVQRMTGVSPLAKGPPPVTRSENACSGSGRKSCNSGRAKAGEKSSTKTSPHENIPPTKQAKLLPTSFDNKLQQIIDSSPSRPTKTSRGSRTKLSTKAVLSTTFESSVNSNVDGESSDSSATISKTGNTNGKSTINGDVKVESGSSKDKTENGAIKEKNSNKLYTISKITESSTLSTTLPTPATTTATATTATATTATTTTLASTSTTTTATTPTISHPRPIQPRPLEMKTNYEALVKSYGLNGMENKLSPFPLDGKHVGFSPALHIQPPLFMDPKIAAQPIKHILSGRGMPLMPETAPYLRNPALANFVQHLHMQPPPPIPGLPGRSTPPLLSTSTSPSPSAAANQHSLSTSTTKTPPTNSNAPTKSSQSQQLKSSATLCTDSSSSSSSNKLLPCSNSSRNSSRASSPVATKLQQKIAPPLTIPTAHITPFMSQS